MHIIKNFFDYIERFGGYKDPSSWVKNMFYAGSTATYHYNDLSDIDIHILIDWDDMVKANPDKYNQDKKQIWRMLHDTFWWTLNKIKLPGTKHPLTYYVVPPGEEDRLLDAKEELYDVGHNLWLIPPGKAARVPEEMMAASVLEATKIMAKLDKEISNVRKDIIDYSLLIQGIKGENAALVYQQLTDKLEAIDSELQEMKSTYDDLKQKRTDAFDNNLGWQDKNNNYSVGNIVFKLIEKYRYMSILRRVKEIIDGQPLKAEQVEEIGDALGLKDIS
jgi:hypothetical protein